jgi:hypothetical protein
MLKDLGHGRGGRQLGKPEYYVICYFLNKKGFRLTGVCADDESCDLKAVLPRPSTTDVFPIK